MTNRSALTLVHKIKNFYSFGKDDSLSHQRAFENYKKVSIKTPSEIEKWERFVKQLKETFPECGIRDFGYENFQHSFSIQITLQKPGLGKSQGLVCMVSLLDRQIGYYFCDYNSTTTNNFSVHPIFTLDKDQFMSYVPYNKSQHDLQRQIHKILLKHFTNHELFSSEMAVFEIDSVFIDGLLYRNVQLFHLYFSHDLKRLI